MRLLLRACVSVSLALSLLVDPADGCGATTHKTVAHRALSTFSPPSQFAKYKEILEMNQGALHAGSTFPDWLYLCGNDHGHGEFVHGMKYQELALAYIEALPTPWDADTKELISFLLGIVSHVEADRVWHELAHVPFGYGFIGSLGAPDFGCYGNLHRCSTAHQAADDGGEFIAAAQTNLMWPAHAAWNVPTRHLLNIFHSGDLMVSALSLDTCNTVFHLLLWLVRVLGAKVYALLAGKWRAKGPCVGTAEWMVPNYLHHPVGGVDDMAARSQWQWERFAASLEGRNSTAAHVNRSGVTRQS
eukprot:CAMPEP_0177734824 /NCGR_PEP_ID=MMETSP0484_2-20121128/24446_1 /TAXON_ID=354590 /ORGANISM="Rhodomonas lens, Strain RHODO" /LENGTH=301 /DNA_ID=CAMNT_0019248341 /DNA_START=10 /DNA_END=911 /DNA_ORIENTATION=+